MQHPGAAPTGHVNVPSVGRVLSTKYPSPQVAPSKLSSEPPASLPPSTPALAQPRMQYQLPRASTPVPQLQLFGYDIIDRSETGILLNLRFLNASPLSVMVKPDADIDSEVEKIMYYGNMGAWMQYRQVEFTMQVGILADSFEKMHKINVELMDIIDGQEKALICAQDVITRYRRECDRRGNMAVNIVKKQKNVVNDILSRRVALDKRIRRLR